MHVSLTPDADLVRAVRRLSRGPLALLVVILLLIRRSRRRSREQEDMESLSLIGEDPLVPTDSPQV